MANESYDVVIIGAGVAGALMAWKLASAGHRVLMLEAGEQGADRLELVGAYATAKDKTPGSPYLNEGSRKWAPSPETDKRYYDQSESKAEFKSTYERRVGGSTWHWLGNVPRLVPSDFRMQSLYGVGIDWPIRYDDLEPWYTAAEQALGVAGDHEEWDNLLGAWRSKPFPMSRIWPSYSDIRVAAKLVGVEYRGTPLQVLSTPQARNSQPYDGRPACAGNSSCVPICPIGAKYDATVHVEKARSANAEIREKTVVTRLEAGASGLIERVHCQTWDGRKDVFSGRYVIVAAHAIESARLLLLSESDLTPKGVANTSDQVGRNLMDHLQGAASALAPEPLYPYRGPPTTSGIDAFRDGSFRSMQSAFRMSLGNDGWVRQGAPVSTAKELIEQGFFGHALKEAIAEQASHHFRISYSTEMLPRQGNRVTLSQQQDAMGLRRPKLSMELDDYNIRAFDTARDVMRTIFRAMGATQMTFATDSRAYSGAGHILGTTRMGDDPRQSVVDSSCRAHDHRNLFIVGASVFPTCGTANPTLTVAALSLRAADLLHKQLAAGSTP